MWRPSSLVSWLAIAAGTALVYLPVKAAVELSHVDETLALLTLVCTIGGMAAAGAVRTRAGREGPRPLWHFAVGALVGAAAGIAIQPLLPSTGVGLSKPPQRFIVASLLDAAGALLVLWGIRQRYEAERRHLVFAAVCLAAVVVLGPGLASGTTIAAHNLTSMDTRSVALYWTVGSALLVLPLIALTTLPGGWFERWWDIVEQRAMAIPNRVFAIALVTAALALAVGASIYCFDRNPASADEVVQLWHAKILLTGRLALPADPNAEFFAVEHMIDHPRWYSQFPIGGPAFLAIGSAVGAAWLVNPVLTGLTALNVYRIGQRMYNEPMARAAATLFVASPMVLVMGGSHMNHVPTAWLVTLAIAALPLWCDSAERRVRIRSAIVIGAAVGVAATIRPLDAVIAALVIGFVMLEAARRDRTRFTSIGMTWFAGAIPVVLLLIANWKTTGGPLRWGYQVLWGPNHSLGLHLDPLGNPHTAGRALLLGVRYAMEVNWWVTAWPVPVMLLLAAALALSRRLQRWDALLLAFFAAQLVAYAFYFHDGYFAGPRFLFPVVPAILLLAARAPFIIAERARGTWRRATLLVVPVCVAAAWIRPMEPFGVRGIARDFRNSRRALKESAPPDSLMRTMPRALVFIQEGAGSRLMRRLWALGVSHADAWRVLDKGDACSVLEFVRAEERREPGDSVGRMTRMEQTIAPYDPSGAGRGPATDPMFRLNGASVVTPACAREIAHDARVARSIAYGPMLLHNELDALGRIDGQVVFVMDLSEHNDVLRARFGDRQWFRWEIPREPRDSMAVLQPYEAELFQKP